MRRTRRSAGVSLIEALVALAVMGFGMLAVVGLQSTLRQNADVAKQRAEAVRIAQMEVERWRAFRVLAHPTDVVTYANLADLDAPGEEVIGTNATYRLTRAVEEPAAPGPAYKTLLVEVSWADRRGDPQFVRLSTAIAAVQPSLAGTLVTPPTGSPTRRPHGRNPQIPWQAKDLGDGTSGLMPPGAPDDVAWRFDNVTGLITLCSVVPDADADPDPEVAMSTADLTRDNLNCTTENALLLAGYVSYALTSDQPQETDALNPASDPINSLTVSVTRSDGGLAPTCYSQAVDPPTRFTIYNCAIPVTVSDAQPRPGWSGSVSFTTAPAALLATTAGETSASKFKVCSYANPGLRVGTASFTGGGSSIVLTNAPNNVFGPWIVGSRIDVIYDRKAYPYTVAAAVARVEPPTASQTVPVREPLPGLTGATLSSPGYRDIWPYTTVAVPLINHNYLVIRAGNALETPTDTDLAFTCPPLTVAHQPAS